MKKLLLISFAMSAMLTVSCGGRNPGARDTADKFVKAFFVDVDIEGSRKYVSEELLEEFPAPDQMSDIEKHFIGILETHAATHGYKFEYEPLLSRIGDDNAMIYYILTAKGNPGWKGSGEVELVLNTDGRWVIIDYAFDRDENAIDFGF